MDQGQYVSQITSALGRLGNDVHVTWSQDDDGADTVAVSARNYDVQLYVNVSRALSLEFTFRDGSGGKPELDYSLDTDLYPIADPKYEGFARVIGEQIVDFLASLAAGTIRVGTFRRREQGNHRAATVVSAARANERRGGGGLISWKTRIHIRNFEKMK